MAVADGTEYKTESKMNLRIILRTMLRNYVALYVAIYNIQYNIQQFLIRIIAKHVTWNKPVAWKIICKIFSFVIIYKKALIMYSVSTSGTLITNTNLIHVNVRWFKLRLQIHIRIMDGWYKATIIWPPFVKDRLVNIIYINPSPDILSEPFL